MRRAVARGRVFPQKFSTDRRIGRISLKSVGLFPFIWTNADDQGRLVGDPEEIKYSCCPNVEHITKQDIAEVLEDLQANDLIICYQVRRTAVIQLLDWWDPKRSPQWAWPSDYPPLQGWNDHLRYKEGAKNVLTLNWPVTDENVTLWPVSAENSGERSGENSGEHGLGTQVREYQVSGENPGENSGERSGEHPGDSPLTTPSLEKEKENGKGEGGRKGNSPENSAEDLPPPPDSDEENPSLPITSPFEINTELTKNFQHEWGRVLASNIDEVIPRVPTGKEKAQLRDLANELSAGGGCTAEYIEQAFQEAARYEKFYIDYVRKVLFAWLGIPDERGNND